MILENYKTEDETDSYDNLLMINEDINDKIIVGGGLFSNILKVGKEILKPLIPGLISNTIHTVRPKVNPKIEKAQNFANKLINQGQNYLNQGQNYMNQGINRANDYMNQYQQQYPPIMYFLFWKRT